MTKEEIKLFQDLYLKEVKHPIDPNRKGTRGEYIRIVLDGGIEFNTQTDFVIFDDEHEMLHIICANDDPYSQFDWPFKIMSASYNIVFVIESILSKDNLNDVFDDSFLGNVIGDERKKIIRTWMDSSNNAIHKAYPMDADPYYTQNPKTIHNGTTIIPRDDGIKRASSTASMASSSVKVIRDKESLISNIKEAENGAIFTITKDIDLDETLVIDKDITILGARHTINSSLDKAIEITANASLDGLLINCDSESGTCISISGDARIVKLKKISLDSKGKCMSINTSKELKLVIESCDTLAEKDTVECLSKCNMIVIDSYINGKADVIHLAENSKESVINISNTQLAIINMKMNEEEKPIHGLLKLEASDINVFIDSKCTAHAIDNNYLFVIGNTAEKLMIELDSDKLTQHILYSEDKDIINKSKISLPAKYRIDIVNCGYKYMYADDKKIIIYN